MVFCLLSPAKTMQFGDTPKGLDATPPHFQTRAVQLVKVLQDYDAKALGRLMAISPALADLNMERFARFKLKPSAKTEQSPAILAYRGDTYQGLDALSLNARQLHYAQDHIGILSGLYGVLQPLDLIQPYRLEMAITLKTAKAKDLYQFWGDAITERINDLAAAARAKAVVGLASQEYLKAVNLTGLAVPFIQCDFKERKNGKLQIVGLLAKKARGMMARYIVTEKITKIADLKGFDLGGYAFEAAESDDTNFTFVRQT